MTRRMLLLQCRNFGDAVIGTGLIEAMADSGQRIEWHVLTRPRFAAIYANNPHVAAVHHGEFPMGSEHRFGGAEAAALLRTVLRLRRLRFERVVNTYGDLRENALGWLVSPAANCGPVWPDGHPQRRNVRQGLGGLLSLRVPVPADEPNLYQSIGTIAAALGADAAPRQRLYDAGKRPIMQRAEPLIGLHPVASVGCKEWPAARWLGLARAIRAQGWKLALFAAPADRARVEADFAPLLGEGTEVLSGGLVEFFGNLARLSCFIGLDSFGVHSAHAVGVPCIMLNGPNPAELVAPPGALLVDGGAGLPCHPCYAKPTCAGQAEPYRCIRGIAEAAVLDQLARLRLGDAAPPSAAPAGAR